MDPDERRQIAGDPSAAPCGPAAGPRRDAIRACGSERRGTGRSQIARSTTDVQVRVRVRERLR